MALKLSAEIALVKDDKSLLDNHTTLIQQTADSITSKASQSSLDTLTGRVANAETAITQTANSINLKVSKDSIINQINLSTEGLSIDVNKLNINGIVTANDYFKINLDGSMEALAGLIGGWTISPSITGIASSGMFNGITVTDGHATNSTGMSNNVGWAFWAGDGRFRVQQDGFLFSMSGLIGGWNINANSLSSGNMTLNSALGRLYVGSGAYLFNYGSTSVMGLNGSINVQGMIYAPSITLNGHVISIDSNGYLKAL